MHILGWVLNHINRKEESRSFFEYFKLLKKCFLINQPNISNEYVLKLNFPDNIPKGSNSFLQGGSTLVSNKVQLQSNFHVECGGDCAIYMELRDGDVTPEERYKSLHNPHRPFA